MQRTLLSRRIFIGTSIIFGLGSIVYFKDALSKTKIYANELQVILHASYHLFPQSSIGPGSIDLRVSNYLAGVFTDKRVLKEDKDYFLKGAYWLEESSFEIYKKSFLNLDREEKEELFQKISTKRWGKNFMGTCLNYIFEALLCAPIYGSNIDEIGWKWLEHNPGFPLPMKKEDINYEI